MKTKNHTQTIVLAAAILCIPSFSSAATLFSDNFSTDTLSTYTLAGSALATYSATGGVGGGGGLIIGQTANDSLSFIPGNPTNSPFTVGSGESVTLSMMLKLNNAGFGGGNSKAFLGLADGANNTWGSNPPTGTSIVGGAMQGTVQIGTRAGGNGGAASNGNMQTTVSLTGGNWYLYSVTLEKPTSGVNWTASSFLQDYGANGTVAGSVVSTFSNLTATPTGDTTLSLAATPTFLNFGVRNQSWSAVDNFSVTAIPEPSVFAIVGLGLLGVATSRRRTC